MEEPDGARRGPARPAGDGARLRRTRDAPAGDEYDESEEFPWPVVRKAAEVGLTCYDLPEDTAAAASTASSPRSRSSRSWRGAARRWPAASAAAASSPARSWRWGPRSRRSAGCRRCARRPTRHRRARHHRAERGLRRRRHDDSGREGRRRIRAERPEDVDLVRAHGRPVHRVRPDGPRLAVARHHGVSLAPRRRGLRDRQEDAEDGRPLLPGGRAVLRRLLRGRRPAGGRRGPGLLRPDAVVRRLARDAGRERRRDRPRGARVRGRVCEGARTVRQEDRRVPGGLVPARRREDEARPGADADLPRGRVWPTRASRSPSRPRRPSWPGRRRPGSPRGRRP